MRECSRADSDSFQPSDQHPMRTLSLVVGVIAVGTLASLPFRRTEAVILPEDSLGIATGPMGHQVENDAMNGVLQWPDRPGFDPTLAWQPRPMTMEASSPVFEMPKMPESFPEDTMRVAVPRPIQDRFAAAVPIPAPGGDPSEVGSNGLLMPPVAQIEDRFVYTPAPAPEPPAGRSTFQSASVVSHDASSSAAEPQYIREPQ
jgi:hypothetical protein